MEKVISKPENDGEMAMRFRPITFAVATLALGACSTLDGTARETRQQEALQAQLFGLAASGQDVATARLRPEDGCYWYRHSGRVETTELPLRTPGGQQICAPSET